MFAKITNNIVTDYPYNPQVDHPNTSFPVGASYPAFDCYWVHPTVPNNPDPELYNPVESTPVFNGDRWEQSWEFVEKPPVPIVPNWINFYDQLLLSQPYQYLLSQTIPTPSISGAMAVMGLTIERGLNDPANPNRLVALQSAVNVLLGTLNSEEVAITLTPEQLGEIRTLLDDNGFNSITLG